MCSLEEDISSLVLCVSGRALESNPNNSRGALSILTHVSVFAHFTTNSKQLVFLVGGWFQGTFRTNVGSEMIS